MIIFNYTNIQKCGDKKHNYYHILALIILTICPLRPLLAQNLISNASFEEYSELPNETAQWYKCIGWNNVNGYLDVPYASPDYFHLDGVSSAKLPHIIFGKVKPHTGRAIMGFGVSEIIHPEYREYISSKLIQPMLPGISYTVSFYLSNGYSTWFSQSSCNGIGLLFSTTSPTQLSHEAIQSEPQIKIEGTIWNEDWQKYTLSFVADSAYEYITIGCFADSLELEFDMSREIKKRIAYYYIDDVEVNYSVQTDPERNICIGDSVTLYADNDTSFRWMAEDAPGIILSTNQTLVVSPQDTAKYIVYGAFSSDTVTVIPSLEYCEPVIELPNIFTPNGDLLNDLFTIRNQFAIKNAQIIIVNRWGEVVFSDDLMLNGWDGSYNLVDCPDGVYFWTLRAVGYNGKVIDLRGNLTLVR